MKIITLFSKMNRTKKCIAIVMLAIISVYTVKSQNKSEDDSGLNISKCSFEPDAPAVVIFDKGNTHFIRKDNGFVIQYKRHKRVKIFDKSAFNQGEVSIELYIGDNDREKVYDIKGVTYNLEGNSLIQANLEKDQIFEEPINKYWYKKKFAMPQIKEGCIIEYTYTMESPFFFQLPDWEFQSNIPTIYSEYKMAMIPFYTYKYIAQGFNEFDIFNKSENGSFERNFMGIKFQDLIYTFGLKNVPSFKDETYISSREDYIRKIDFQLAEINYPQGYSKKYMETWPKLANDYLRNPEFGKYINKTEKIGAKEFSHLTSLTEKERVDAILNYMKENYKFNGYNNKIVSKSFKEFTTEKTGNSANINLMALGFLRSVHIEAEPVLISTRNHGKVHESFPFAGLFNYVIIYAKVNGKIMVLDATDPYCPNNMIPAKCSNGKGFIVKEDSVLWVHIGNDAISYHSTTIEYTLNPDGNNFEGSGLVKSKGHLSVEDRAKYSNDVKKISKELESKGINTRDSIEIIEQKKDSKNFEYRFSFKQNIEKVDDQIVFSPFFNLPQQENPFTQEKRELPIDIVYPRAESFYAIIVIPEGYRVEELPLPVNTKSENTAFSYQAMINNKNKILITSNYVLKSATYPASDYDKLKILFNQVIQKMNQKILLVQENEVSLRE